MLLEETYGHRMEQVGQARVTALNRLQQAKAEGMKISTLVADPNWELYGRYIEREKERHEASAKDQEAFLCNINNPIEGKELLTVRLRLAHNQGASEAYTLALSIAKILIEHGEQAEAEIAKLISVEAVP